MHTMKLESSTLQGGHIVECRESDSRLHQNSLPRTMAPQRAVTARTTGQCTHPASPTANETVCRGAGTTSGGSRESSAIAVLSSPSGAPPSDDLERMTPDAEEARRTLGRLRRLPLLGDWPGIARLAWSSTARGTQSRCTTHCVRVQDVLPAAQGGGQLSVHAARGPNFASRSCADSHIATPTGEKCSVDVGDDAVLDVAAVGVPVLAVLAAARQVVAALAVDEQRGKVDAVKVGDDGLEPVQAARTKPPCTRAPWQRQQEPDEPPLTTTAVCESQRGVGCRATTTP